MVSTLVALSLAVSVLCAALGLVWRLALWLKAASHPRHALHPAPRSRAGVALRLLREGMLFESLWRASPVTWLLGWPMHVALALVLVQHLRYPMPGWSVWIELVAAYGHVASAVLGVSLAGLWARRILVNRVRYVSRPSDHLWLALLLGLVATGAALKYLIGGDVASVRRFVRGLLGGEVVALPASPVLWLHLLLASVLIAAFPFSKLLHGVAVWVNPTRASRAGSGRGAA